LADLHARTGLGLFVFLHTLPDSYVPDGRSQFGIQYTYGHHIVTICVYTWESSWNPVYNTLESDRPRRNRPAACYRPAIFFRHFRHTALSFRQGKIWCALKNVIPYYLPFL